MHDDVWDDAAGRWVPDRWEALVDAATAYRDRVAASVDGPVPVYGTPGWATADDDVKAVAQARHDQAAAVERGRQVSAVMAARTSSVAAHRALMNAITDEQAGVRAARVSLPTPLQDDVIAQRAADAELRRDTPRPWDPGYAESFAARAQDQRASLDADLDAVCSAVRAAARAAEVTSGEDAATDDDAEDHPAAPADDDGADDTDH